MKQTTALCANVTVMRSDYKYVKLTLRIASPLSELIVGFHSRRETFVAKFSSSPASTNHKCSSCPA
jgi:hypothetical protein